MSEGDDKERPPAEAIKAHLVQFGERPLTPAEAGATLDEATAAKMKEDLLKLRDNAPDMPEKSREALNKMIDELGKPDGERHVAALQKMEHEVTPQAHAEAIKAHLVQFGERPLAPFEADAKLDDKTAAKMKEDLVFLRDHAQDMPPQSREALNKMIGELDKPDGERNVAALQKMEHEVTPQAHAHAVGMHLAEFASRDLQSGPPTLDGNAAAKMKADLEFLEKHAPPGMPKENQEALHKMIDELGKPDGERNVAALQKMAQHVVPEMPQGMMPQGMGPEMAMGGQGMPGGMPGGPPPQGMMPPGMSPDAMAMGGQGMPGGMPPGTMSGGVQFGGPRGQDHPSYAQSMPGAGQALDGQAVAMAPPSFAYGQANINDIQVGVGGGQQRGGAAAGLGG